MTNASIAANYTHWFRITLQCSSTAQYWHSLLTTQYPRTVLNANTGTNVQQGNAMLKHLSRFIHTTMSTLEKQ